MDNEKLLEQARDRFKQADEYEEENRRVGLEDLRFARLGEQWGDEDRRKRESEGRPILTINKLPTFIRQVVNDARQNKPSIKVHPVDDTSDPETAEVLNGLIRNIEVISNADAAYDTATDNAVSMNIGYIRVDIDYACDDTFDQDILIDRVINPHTVYGDPQSTAVDSSDWRFCFVTELMTEDDFKEKYPNAEPVDFEGSKHEEYRSHWFPDKMIQVAEYWVRKEVEEPIVRLSDGQVVKKSDFEAKIEGEEVTAAELAEAEGVFVQAERTVKTHQVKQYVMNGQEVLEENDWPGRYIPIVPVYGEEVVVEGKRHFLSLVHFAKDPQRMFNYWRTTTTELVALAPKAPWVGPEGSFVTDAERWGTANTVSHPFLEYDSVVKDGVPMPPPSRQPFADIPAGALQEAMSASDDLKAVTGMYDASLGARGNEVSGIAIRERRVEGDNSTFHFIDNVSRAIRHLGKIIVDLIPRVYSDERIVRVLGEDGKPQNVPVNQEIETENGPRIYDLATGKYDVTVKAGPSYATQRQEAASQMIDLIKAYPAAAPLLGDLLAKNLDWADADEIERRLQSLLPDAVKGQNPEVELLKTEISRLGAVIKKLEEDKALEIEKLRIETKRVEIDAFEAETDRMEAEAKIRAEFQPVVPGAYPV